MPYTFMNLIEEVLSRSERPLSRDEIWNHAEKLHLTEKLASKGKTPALSIGSKIYLDLKNNQKTRLYKQGTRPVKFGIKNSENTHNDDTDYFDEDEHDEMESDSIEQSLDTSDNLPSSSMNSAKEKNLHILLSTFLRSSDHFRCHTKTIPHQESLKGKKGYNGWLHPDIVGVYFPFEDYDALTLSLIDSFKESAFRFFSFEIKLKITLRNLRECFFQALSNSNWAHEGYLATLWIDDEIDLLDEFQRLNNAFGIGLIRIDPINIDQSEILYTAKQRATLDWQTINRLAVENKTFATLLQDIMDDIEVDKIKSKYDDILSSENVESYSRENNFL